MTLLNTAGISLKDSFTLKKHLISYLKNFARHVVVPQDVRTKNVPVWRKNPSAATIVDVKTVSTAQLEMEYLAIAVVGTGKCIYIPFLWVLCCEHLLTEHLQLYLGCFFVCHCGWNQNSSNFQWSGDSVTHNKALNTISKANRKRTFTLKFCQCEIVNITTYGRLWSCVLTAHIMV